MCWNLETSKYHDASLMIESMFAAGEKIKQERSKIDVLILIYHFFVKTKQNNKE